MKNSTKIWLVVGLFIIAIIIAFAIYKGVGTSKDTTVTTSGGTVSQTSNGLGGLIASIAALWS